MVGNRLYLFMIFPVFDVSVKYRLLLTHVYAVVFTVRRYASHGICYRNSVCPSVCHTRGLCQHGSTYDHDFFTIW